MGLAGFGVSDQWASLMQALVSGKSISNPTVYGVRHFLFVHSYIIHSIFQ